MANQVRPTSGDFGSTIPQLFGSAIPIRAIVADQHAALFGECCFDVGDSKITIGTGCFIDTNTGSQPLVSPNGYLCLCYEIAYEVVILIPTIGCLL